MTDDLHALAAAYALDALDPDERRQFEAHFPECPTCRSEVADYRRTAGRLGALVPSPLPADLKDRVMTEVRQTRQMPPPVTHRGHSRWSRPLLAVAAAVVVLALAGGLLLWRGSDARNGSTRPDELAQVLSEPDASTIQLADLDGGSGTLRVVYSHDTGKAVIVGSALPDPGDGRTYQLWSVSGQTVRSAGVFDPTATGSVNQTVALPEEPVDVWGVTNEPSGGSPKATTEMVYASEKA
ncbi:MAG TPA: anti-sigma factor [Microthrixaceae bacterium]|nr:anti-sigma factor [Microthrixaceae bacterium]